MFEMTGTIHWANDPCVRVPGLPYSRVFRLGTAFLWFAATGLTSARLADRPAATGIARRAGLTTICRLLLMV